MNPRVARISRLLAIFALGLLAGVYLQHRWPLGRWREHVAPRPAVAQITLADIAALPAHRRLVVVVAGQSNAANHGETRAFAGKGVYAYHDGRLLAAEDPLPGGDQIGGSIWTRLGARLMLAGDYDAVVFAVNALGATRVDQWAPGGEHHPRLASTLDELIAAGLPPDFFLWQQGETEGWDNTASGPDYARSLRALLDAVWAVSPSTTVCIAEATYGAHTPSNAQIRAAQQVIESLPRTLPGPDLDSLDAPWRADGVHFNQRGLEAAADLWLESLRPALKKRASGP
jgi:hypothetical protein